MGPHTALAAIGNVTERTTKHTEFNCKTWTTERSDFLGANNSENGRKSHLIAEIDMDHVPFDESIFLSTWISEVTNRLPGGRDRMNFLIRAIKMKTTTSVFSVISTLGLELLFLLWKKCYRQYNYKSSFFLYIISLFLDLMITSLSTLSLQISFLMKQDSHREHNRKDKEEDLFLHLCKGISFLSLELRYVIHRYIDI